VLAHDKTLLVPAKNPYSRDPGHVTQSDEDDEGLKIFLLNFTPLHHFLFYVVVVQ
jgi:hypothetical protein